jgi:hypothetical protein
MTLVVISNISPDDAVEIAANYWISWSGSEVSLYIMTMNTFNFQTFIIQTVVCCDSHCDSVKSHPGLPLTGVACFE